MGDPPLKYRTDFDKHVVTCNFERRGWERWDPRYDDDWHVFWASVSTVKQIFAPENGIRLGDHQIVNHFPNHYELTRKDLMVKNVKRFRKECEKEAALESNGAGQCNGNFNTTGMSATELLPKLDFVPATFSLPSDYSLFVEEFRRAPDRTWIMKPIGKAQGKGIFLINKLTQIKKWSNGYNAKDGPDARWKTAEERKAENDKTESYIVSRYVQDPLLIGGKKFDLRVYVVVTSYRPLRAFVSRLGFARFCSVSYSEAKADMDNPFVHLTNGTYCSHRPRGTPRGTLNPKPLSSIHASIIHLTFIHSFIHPIDQSPFRRKARTTTRRTETNGPSTYSVCTSRAPWARRSRIRCSVRSTRPSCTPSSRSRTSS